MSDPLNPLRATRSVGDDDRRSGRERRSADAEPEQALVPTAAPPQAAAPSPDGRRSGLSEFFAQLLGQGPRRGLKGGPQTLDDARSTYLGAEYSGAADRRPPKGTVKRDV